MLANYFPGHTLKHFNHLFTRHEREVSWNKSKCCGINLGLDFIIKKKCIGPETPPVENCWFSSKEKTSGRAGGGRGQNLELLMLSRMERIRIEDIAGTGSVPC